MVDWEAYDRYLSWYDDGIKYCVRMRAQWTAADIASVHADDPEDEAIMPNRR